ncbi:MULTISPECIES: 3-deoxy-7-phosphoheptulonate synthase [Pyrobaculum]|uniref:3-deoxy-D-arabinoheptulosonate-7-phosphate synthase n=2 Tax=Pyrobaculum arsenaticum TaxID=121277 RepID=A4WMN6_PYRAR|nr:3-deoxy-7-phosphoheptulonate synthase [Pyrobaculum arsenaticum]ABP51653.1 3-deoxy-D-arabinoheptulosonate-7-phosphate synthase [Pyrobaculum arsenaticum DSM 13514]MCY0890694.1 3-deoxy-7-phosphoheptulonate synthase [Pyrobaculum arsenaticum]NYR15973.1 3-deoxy-7-phosphoheptulonate synthase [Pyrobaculum arsenaticum]
MLYIVESYQSGKALKEEIESRGIPAWYVELWGNYIVATPPGTKIDGLRTPVKAVVELKTDYQLVSRQWKRDPTPVVIGDREIREGKIFIIAGPCSVETEEQILTTARAVKEAGADALRGGAFKPRTSPYAFQGLGERGLILLAKAREATGLPITTELMDPEDLPLVTKYADAIQVGARNMQNFTLLKKLGRAEKPILLKRGFGNTIDEWLLAAEYVALHGNGNIVLVERGIRTYDKTLRFTLDVGAIAFAKQHTHLPVIGDPSHPAGDRRYVIPLALAILAAGADGLIVEVHPDPDKAWSDAKQQLTFQQFEELVAKAKALAKALGKD